MHVESILRLACLASLLTVAACQNEPAPPAGATAAATGVPVAAAEGRNNGFDTMPPPGTKARCPVMGDEFEVKADSPSSVYQGKTYVFCCPDCKPKFDAAPEKYLKG